MAFAGNQPPGQETQQEKSKLPWCVLGTLEFRLITSPSRYATGWKWNYVEHDRIEGKPTLQQVGGTLRTIDLDFQFHGEFCKPADKLQELIDLANKGEAVSLVIGSQYLGYWVIEDIPLTVKKTTEEAELLAIEVSVKLKEWVGVGLEGKRPTQTGFVQRDRSTFSGTIPTNTA